MRNATTTLGTMSVCQSFMTFYQQNSGPAVYPGPCSTSSPDYVGGHAVKIVGCVFVAAVWLFVCLVVCGGCCLMYVILFDVLMSSCVGVSVFVCYRWENMNGVPGTLSQTPLSSVCLSVSLFHVTFTHAICLSVCLSALQCGSLPTAGAPAGATTATFTQRRSDTCGIESAGAATMLVNGQSGGSGASIALSPCLSFDV